MVNRHNDNIKSNMYAGTDTWSPIAGKCKHDCLYCYIKSYHPNARKLYEGKNFLIEKRIKEDLKEGGRIFIQNSGDLMEQSIPSDWIKEVIHHISKYYNDYIFLTKNPRRYFEFLSILEPMKERVELGCTIESNRTYFDSLAPPMILRAKAMKELREKWSGVIFISIEPVMDFDDVIFTKMIEQIHPNYCVIGSDSKNHRLNEPSRNKLLGLIHMIEVNGTEVRLKDNLDRLLKKRG